MDVHFVYARGDSREARRRRRWRREAAERTVGLCVAVGEARHMTMSHDFILFVLQ